MRQALLLLLLLLLIVGLPAGEALVCRGFEAATAVRAVISTSGRLLTLDPNLAGQRVWFALADNDPVPARQALAHALGCWWTAAPSGQITREARLSGQDASVQAFPPLPFTPSGSEALLQRLLDPWLGGNGGLALDTGTGSWSATASPTGLARLEQLLSAMGDPSPRAPHLVSADPPGRPFPRSPHGADLGSWCIDLAACAGVAVALASDSNPAAPAPTGTVTTVNEAIAAVTASGLSAALHHRCLGVGLAAPVNRLHPAERATVAILPIGHLCRDDAQVVQLSAQLGARVTPQSWDQPGWAIAPLAWRHALLVVADPPTIHLVMTALEAADQIGLEAWLQ